MMNISDNPNIDVGKKIERNIDGCKVRLFFCVKRNEKIERLVLDNLMLTFDRKMQGSPMVQN